MKMVHLVSPYCFFLALDFIMSFGVVASGDEFSHGSLHPAETQLMGLYVI